MVTKAHKSEILIKSLQPLRNEQVSILYFDPSSLGRSVYPLYLSEQFNWSVTEVTSVTAAKIALRENLFDIILLRASPNPKTAIMDISVISANNAAALMVLSNKPNKWMEFVTAGAEGFFDESRSEDVLAAQIYSWVRCKRGNYSGSKDYQITDEITLNNLGELDSVTRVRPLTERQKRLLMAFLMSRGRILSECGLCQSTSIANDGSIRTTLSQINHSVTELMGRKINLFDNYDNIGWRIRTQQEIREQRPIDRTADDGRPNPKPS